MMNNKKNMPRKRQFKSNQFIGEEIRIAVQMQLQQFLRSESEKEFAFPSSLTADERAYIHELSKQLGLHSKSRGKATNRFLTVYKREGSSIVQTDPSFTLARPSRQEIISLLQKFPLTSKERQDLLPLTERERGGPADALVKDKSKNLGRLGHGFPQVPTAATPNKDLLGFRQALPIWPRRTEIMDTINNNQVIVVSGQTGSGKTTQVPQFILEQCSAGGKPCRIICTQPRRISAVSVCERVSAERNESVGQAIGYQIRLESLVSPRTVLTYCTDGVLLRTLMGGDGALGTVTHIIIDEVHERNRYSDFLLIVIKEALVKYRSLKLILMSATIDTTVFTTYFNNCPVISVPGRQYDVEEYFLEDVLKYTGYMTPKKMKKINKKGGNRAELENWSKMVTNQIPSLLSISTGIDSNAQQVSAPPTTSQETEEAVLPEHVIEIMDQAIQNAFIVGTEEAFNFLAYTMHNENVSVDYQHSGTCVTPLMVAACRGNLDWTEQFLELGADISAKDAKEMTALDWARKLEQSDIVDLLEAYAISVETKNPADDVALSVAEMPLLKEEDKLLLDLYFQNFRDENESIDYDLVMELLIKIHTTTDSSGAILIFIAGYDDIVVLRDKIMYCDKVLKSAHNFALYTLHSNMQTSDQKRVFRPTPKGVRKIIISTNIAETSITIDDVVYVIDCGKVKEKSYDCISGACLLRATWISRSCSRQRKGRAGRTQPGKCYHIFSSVRYASLMNYRTPEILRLPLQELCLQTKLLAPPNTAIADFLAKAIQPPSTIVTRTAVVLLKAMDALDPWEDLTELGRHLLDLPVEPRLGKTLLYSIVLKCLDPVLTIVCCLAYKEPFVLPSQPGLKWAANESRRGLSAGALSDHMALLRGFQCWQNARANSKERLFCEKNFLSSATLEMIQGTRTQLLGQLRASGFVRQRGHGDMRDLNHNSENWAVVKACLCAGMYPNLARVDRKHSLLRTQKEIKVTLHPSSTIRDTASLKGTVQTLPSDWVIYEEMSRPGKFCNIRCCTVVSPITVAIFAGPCRMPLANITEASAGGVGAESDSEEEDVPLQETALLKIDDWVAFRVDREAVQISLELRQKWNAMFLRRMKTPDKPSLQVDEAVLAAVVRVLSAEEKALGLSQPDGVGQRPKQTNSEYFQESARRGFEDATNFNHNVVVNGSTNSFYSNPRTERPTGEHSALPTNNVESLAALKDLPPLSENTSGVTNMSYFIIKAASERALEFSARHSAWAFSPNTERKLMRLRKGDHVVVLLFSVQGSGHFQGYAVLTGTRVPGLSTEVWGEQASRCPNPPLSIKWVKRGNVPFQATRHMLNSYNENNRVQTSRDGQQLEPIMAQQLCALWNKSPNVTETGLESSRSTYGGSPPHRNSHHGRPIRGVAHSGGRARNSQHRYAGQTSNTFQPGAQYY